MKSTYVAAVVVVVALALLYHSFVEHSSFIARDKCIIGYRNVVAVIQFGQTIRHVSTVFGRSQRRHGLMFRLLVFGPSRSAFGIVAFRSVIRIGRASIGIGCGVLGCCVRGIRRTGIMIIQIMAAVTEW